MKSVEIIIGEFSKQFYRRDLVTLLVLLMRPAGAVARRMGWKQGIEEGKNESGAGRDID